MRTALDFFFLFFERLSPKMLSHLSVKVFSPWPGCHNTVIVTTVSALGSIHYLMPLSFTSTPEAQVEEKKEGLSY